MQKNYIRIAAKIYKEPWCIQPSMLDSIACQFEAHRASGQMVELPQEEETEEVFAGPVVVGETAIITLEGIMGRRLSMLETMCGGVDTNTIKNHIQLALDNPDVSNIILDISSPGGSVQGTPELAAFIAEANEQKKIYAWVETLCASAALWVASQCEAVFLAETAEIGSCGVYCLLIDESERLSKEGLKVNAITNEEATFKLAGASFKPLTEEERTYFKEGVQETYKQFKAAVQSKRVIKDEYLDGRMFTGPEAIALGFADGLCDGIEEVLTLITQ